MAYDYECKECYGDGWILEWLDNWLEPEAQQVICVHCNGRGIDPDLDFRVARLIGIA